MPMLCLIVGSAPALVGCAPAAYSPAAIQHETYTVNSPHVVLDTPPVLAHRLKQADSTGGTAGQPWWMTRNDGRLNIRPGSNVARYRLDVVEVRDYQRTSENDVNDFHRRRVTSVQIGPISP